MEPVTANAELAARLRGQADDAILRRKALLCASVALAETKTVPAAIKVIRDCRLPAEISEAAVELLDELTREGT
jgi:hypothetical protein